MFARTPIGGLLLDQVEGWTFAVQDGVIAGRFREDEGILRIATVASNRLPQPVTHETCLLRAAKLADVAGLSPSNWKTLEGVTGPYGSAHFERDSERVFVWYCCRAPGVIVASYSCSTKASRTLANRGLRAQCNTMITTALFDRRIWGGTDQLRLWAALLGADEVEEDW